MKLGVFHLVVFLQGRLLAQLLGLPIDIASPCRAATAADQPGFTRASGIIKLTNDQASRLYPVQLQGVVTFYYPEYRLLFVQDSSAGIYVAYEDTDPAIRAGVGVEVEGTTHAGSYRPIIAPRSIKVLGNRELPPGRTVSLSSLSDGHEDCQWVRVEGIIRSVTWERDYVTLELVQDRSRLKVHIIDFPKAPSIPLVNARVAVRGVVGTLANSARQPIGITLWVPSGKEISMLSAPPSDAFSIPITSIATIAALWRQSRPEQRVRVQGLVMSQQQKEAILLKDDSGLLRVKASETTSVYPGDRIDVVGFLATDGNEPSLEEAIYRRLDSRATSNLEDKNLPLLTRIAQIRNLSMQEAARGFPVRIRGVITYWDPTQQQVFVQDASAAIYVEIGTQLVNLATGQKVEIEGSSAPGDFAPIIVRPRFRNLGTAAPPNPRRVSLDRLQTGAEDSNLVEIEGIVRTSTPSYQHTILEVVQEGKRVRVTIPYVGDQTAAVNFDDARVRVRAVCAVRFNVMRQVSSFQLFAPSLDDIIVEEPAPQDPFSVPTREIRDIFRYTTEKQAGHRAKIQGQAIYQQPGRGIYLKDETGNIYAQTLQTLPVQPGIRLVVLGYPTLGEFGPILEDSIIRQIYGTSNLVPEDITDDQALSGNYQGGLVRVRGLLLDRLRSITGPTLIFQSGKSIFDAVLETSEVDERVESLSNGSQVEVTGICLVREEGGQRNSFRLLLRSPADLRILARPSWWTRKHTLWTVSILLIVIFAVVAWAVTLKRRVSRQTQILRAQLESEAALEKKYRDLFESSNDIIFICDQDGNLTDINKAVEKITGYSPEDVLREWLHSPLEMPAIQEGWRWLAQKMAGADFSNLAQEFTARDGRRITLEISATVILRDGRPAGIQGVARDITKRKRDEERIRNTNILKEELLKPGSLTGKLQSITDALVVLFAADFARIWISKPGDLCAAGCIHAAATEGPHVCRIRDRCLHLLASAGRYMHTNGLGHRRVPFGCYKIGRVATGEDSWFITNDVQQDPRVHDHTWAKQLGLVAFAGYRLTSTEGQPIGVLALFSCHPLDAEDAAFLEMLAKTASEVIQTAAAEEALRESEVRFRAAFEQAAVGMAQVGLDGRWLRVNQKLCDIVGYTREELLQRTFQSITYPDDLQADLNYFRQMLAGEIHSYSMEKRYIRKDGSLVWINLTVGMLRQPSGAPNYFISVVEDITERKQTEEQHQILQAQFIQAQKMESVGRLAGGVAHDFNNLLSVILGYSELSLGDPALQDRHLRESLLEIQRAGERAKGLTGQLLAFGRKQVLEMRPVNLSRVVSGFETMLQRLIGEDIKIVTHLNPSSGTVMADTSQIEQVLLNLSVNARDAMSDGGMLTIETSPAELDESYARKHGSIRPGSYVMLAVSDTGSGMDESTLIHIFEPFFTTKEKGRGTGLGLSTVYGIVKQHGGEIWVYSEHGHGTTFKIYLPAAPEHAEQAVVAEIQPVSCRGNETILVAEDDPVLRRLTCNILVNYGYQILESLDVQEAIRMAVEKRAAIKLLLTDVIMPEMNGPQLFEKIAAFCPGIRVVYMSGYTQNVIMHHGVLREGIHLIQKPFTVDSLTQKIRAALAG